MKNIIFFLISMASIIGISSCKKYMVEVPAYIPDILIEGTQATAYHKVIGDTLRILPEVSYGGQAAIFSYKWLKLINTGGPAVYKFIGDTPLLEYVLDTLGESSFRLEVTNDATGIMTSRNIYVSVTARAERGIYILKENAAGNTDMDALFISLSKGRFLGENLISIANGGALVGRPVGLGYLEKYRKVTFDTTVTPNRWVNADFSAYQLVSEKEVLIYKMKEEVVLKNTKAVFFDRQVSNDVHFERVISTPDQAILLNKGKPFTFLRTSSGYLSAPQGTYNLSPYFTQRQRISWSDFSNYILGFDNASKSFIYIKNGSQTVSYFPDEYLEGSKEINPTKISSNNMGGDISFLENTSGSLDTNSSEHTRAYALFYTPKLKDKVVLLGLNMAELSGASNKAQHSPIRSADTLSNTTFIDASHYTLNKLYPLLYFSKNNVLGMYNIDTKKMNLAYHTFSAGEEITFMKYINYSYTDANGYKMSHLFVATHVKGNYKLYQFEATANNLKLVDVIQGTGKVHSIHYASVDSKEDSNMNYGVSTYY